MNNRNVGVHIALILVACLLLAGTALAQEQGTERPVRMKDLPQAVQATVRAESRGAIVRGLSMETENGQTFYEVELRVKGRIKDVLIDANGNVVEVEEQVTLASLPPAARAEIVRQAGKGRILLVESIKKNNAVVAYEAHVRTAGKISEIKVDPDGKPLPPE
ncbi:MAG: PepSY domain-containing protein [Blastocatellia bacterium]